MEIADPCPRLRVCSISPVSSLPHLPVFVSSHLTPSEALVDRIVLPTINSVQYLLGIFVHPEVFILIVREAGQAKVGLVLQRHLRVPDRWAHHAYDRPSFLVPRFPLVAYHSTVLLLL